MEILRGWQAVCLFLLGAFYMFVMNYDLIEIRTQISKVVEQCEQHLPRNKHCEPVISAKIVEE